MAATTDQRRYSGPVCFVSGWVFYLPFADDVRPVAWLIVWKRDAHLQFPGVTQHGLPYVDWAMDGIYRLYKMLLPATDFASTSSYRAAQLFGLGH